MNNEINEKNHDKSNTISKNSMFDNKRFKTFNKEIDEKDQNEDNKNSKVDKKIIFDKKIKAFDNEINETI